MRIFERLPEEVKVEARPHVIRIHEAGASRERALVIVVFNLGTYVHPRAPLCFAQPEAFSSVAHRLDALLFFLLLV